MTKKFIICDLDGTLYNSAHRMHLVDMKLWDEFHMASVGDQPNWDVLMLLVEMAGAFEIIGCTGRYETYRVITEEWLNRYGVPMGDLLMRPDGDFRPDPEVKLELVSSYLHSRNEQMSSVLFALEDRDKMVDCWRGAGIPCYQVRPSGY